MPAIPTPPVVTSWAASDGFEVLAADQGRSVSSDDLATYLGIASIDANRANLVLGLALELCESIVNPLPFGATAVVLDVAARAYSNPTNVQQETTGPFSANFGVMGGGLWLTRQNKATLRRLGGSGGAFTIDTMPATAGANLAWWDLNGLSLDWSTEAAAADSWSSP